MSGNPTTGGQSPVHGHPRVFVFLVVLILLACLGTYWTTVTFTPLHTPAASPVTNRTVVVYHNTTVFQNTTHNVTTPIFDNTTVWHNSTNYQNGTFYRTNTVYVNTTEVMMIPVVNVTGISWAFSSTGPFAGKIAAALGTPTEPGFVHSYPLGTVMWIEVNITNNATSTGRLSITPSSPFVLCDSQPSLPNALPPASTLTVELSIGVPYTPGAYTLGLTVSVT